VKTKTVKKVRDSPTHGVKRRCKHSVLATRLGRLEAETAGLRAICVPLRCRHSVGAAPSVAAVSSGAVWGMSSRAASWEL